MAFAFRRGVVAALTSAALVNSLSVAVADTPSGEPSWATDDTCSVNDSDMFVRMDGDTTRAFIDCLHTFRVKNHKLLQRSWPSTIWFSGSGSINAAIKPQSYVRLKNVSPDGHVTIKSSPSTTTNEISVISPQIGENSTVTFDTGTFTITGDAAGGISDFTSVFLLNNVTLDVSMTRGFGIDSIRRLIYSEGSQLKVSGKSSAEHPLVSIPSGFTSKNSTTTIHDTGTGIAFRVGGVTLNSGSHLDVRGTSSTLVDITPTGEGGDSMGVATDGIIIGSEGGDGECAGFDDQPSMTVLRESSTQSSTPSVRTARVVLKHASFQAPDVEFTSSAYAEHDTVFVDGGFLTIPSVHGDFRGSFYDSNTLARIDHSDSPGVAIYAGGNVRLPEDTKVYSTRGKTTLLYPHRSNQDITKDSGFWRPDPTSKYGITMCHKSVKPFEWSWYRPTEDSTNPTDFGADDVEPTTTQQSTTPSTTEESAGSDNAPVTVTSTVTSTVEPTPTTVTVTQTIPTTVISTKPVFVAPYTTTIPTTVTSTHIETTTETESLVGDPTTVTRTVSKEPTIETTTVTSTKPVFVAPYTSTVTTTTTVPTTVFKEPNPVTVTATTTSTKPVFVAPYTSTVTATTTVPTTVTSTSKVTTTRKVAVHSEPTTVTRTVQEPVPTTVMATTTETTTPEPVIVTENPHAGDDGGVSSEMSSGENSSILVALGALVGIISGVSLLLSSGVFPGGLAVLPSPVPLPRL